MCVCGSVTPNLHTTKHGFKQRKLLNHSQLLFHALFIHRMENRVAAVIHHDDDDEHPQTQLI